MQNPIESENIKILAMYKFIVKKKAKYGNRKTRLTDCLTNVNDSPWKTIACVVNFYEPVTYEVLKKWFGFFRFVEVAMYKIMITKIN